MTTAERIQSLTPRERQVMALVYDGLMNKQIAARLNLSMKTVEAHRSRMYAKMGIDSVAILVRTLCGENRNE